MRGFAIVAVIVGCVVTSVASPSGPSAVRGDDGGLACRAQGRKSVVGKVTGSHGTVFQGKERLHRGDALLKNGTVCTGPRDPFETTYVDFTLTKHPETTCRMDPGSRLRLYPSDVPAIIKFELGTSFCGTGNDKAKKRFYVDQVLVTSDDPLFAAKLSGKRAVVKVVRGLVRVRGRTGRSMLVAAGQQTTVPAKGAAQTPVPLVLTPEEKKGFNAVKAAIPKPDFTRPDADGSPTLKRIFGRDELRIGLGFASTEDAASLDFAGTFFDFLAQSWRLSSYTGADQRAALLETLRARNLDAVVANNLGHPKALETIPLFTDQRGSVWVIAFEPDSTFGEALRRFIRSAVNGGQYSAYYRSAFGREPSFDVLRTVLSG